ncbi:MAG: TatD family hydrolase, partial [Betaproteobacteria bacterium]|nr:TatD family hydrolase [Betaproteobacteria bacterium]
MPPTFFDSHCHVHDERMPGGTTGAIQRARNDRVAGMITVGCDRTTSVAAIAVAADHDDVWATVGLHPHDAVQGVDTIVDLLDQPGVIAVGEAGLDYYYEHS